MRLRDARKTVKEGSLGMLSTVELYALTGVDPAYVDRYIEAKTMLDEHRANKKWWQR